MNRTRDPLHTPVCDLLGIEYPIFSAPMGFVATPELVAAVSEAGGCGILPAVFDTPDELRAKIRRIRAVTQKPFGVNILFAQQIADPDSEEGRRLKANQEGQLEVVFDERVPLVSAALGNPGPLVAEAHRRGALVVSSVGNTRQARRVAEAGVDIIVATGYEGGGHSGRVGSAVLWPAVVSAVSVPVLAAGG
ncbi:MAG: nitronate monooxygenase, partial [Clostridia bacterium]|nr:nitronate monooxygenase [Clostridia bacterium]